MKTTTLKSLPKLIMLIIPAFFITANIELNAQKLEKVWETDQVLKTPESVAVDQKNRVLYVSNVNENPWELDGNGFISKLDFDGNVIDINWTSEKMHGPKGMGVINDLLYVADIDAVLAIDTKTGKIKKRYPADANSGLNDISISSDGKIFVSGSNSNKIFTIKEDELVVFLEDDFERPNGLLAENDRLLTLTSGCSKLYEMGYENPEKTELASDLGHGDGIVKTDDGTYILSDWSGRIFAMNKNNNVTTLSDTRDAEINAADIAFLPEKQLLLVPTFFDNRVVAYKIKK